MDKPYIKKSYITLSGILYRTILSVFGNGLDRSLFSWNYADFKSELCIVAQYTSYTWRATFIFNMVLIIGQLLLAGHHASKKTT